MYAVKEIYTTLQGEGAQTGRAAVFLRFAGCNLWSGLERDRDSAVCRFCDTDFTGADGPGGGKFADAEALANAALKVWSARSVMAGLDPAIHPAQAGKKLDGRLKGGHDGTRAARGTPFIVCTGGEPLLQLDATSIAALHGRGFEIAIETNGTQPAPPGIDWICVSPKADAPLVLTSGDELKLVFPQAGGEPERFEQLDFGHFFLQPMDGPDLRDNIWKAVRYCLRHPQWRLSLQTHKLIGLP